MRAHDSGQEVVPVPGREPWDLERGPCRALYGSVGPAVLQFLPWCDGQEIEAPQTLEVAPVLMPREALWVLPFGLGSARREAQLSRMDFRPPDRRSAHLGRTSRHVIRQVLRGKCVRAMPPPGLEPRTRGSREAISKASFRASSEKGSVSISTASTAVHRCHTSAWSLRRIRWDSCGIAALCRWTERSRESVFEGGFDISKRVRVAGFDRVSACTIRDDRGY